MATTAVLDTSRMLPSSSNQSREFQIRNVPKIGIRKPRVASKAVTSLTHISEILDSNSGRRLAAVTEELQLP